MGILSLWDTLKYIMSRWPKKRRRRQNDNVYFVSGIFHRSVLGAADHYDNVDTMRGAHHDRLLPGRTSGQNGRQDSDHRRFVVVPSSVPR